MYTAGQASALKTSARLLPPARACLSINQRRSNSSLHLQSPVTKQREPVHAHQKRYSSRIFDFHLFSKKKDIFKSPYDVLSRNKNRLNDSSWRIYVRILLARLFFIYEMGIRIWCFNKHVMNFKSYYFWQKHFLTSKALESLLSAL